MNTAQSKTGMHLVVLATVSYVFMYICEIVLLEKLVCDSKSVSSLESCDSDRPMKSSDVPQQAASPCINCHNSCADTDNASTPCDVRESESDSNMPALVSSNLSSCSPRLKEGLLWNDSNLESSTSRMESSCHITTDSLQTDVLQTSSNFNSANSLSNKNDSSQNVSQTATYVCDHALSDCNATQLLEDFVEAVTPVQNCVPKGSVTSSEGCAAIGLQNKSSLNATKWSDTVEDHSGAASLGLCVSIDSAFKSQDVKHTILSPSEDFQSIYASNSNLQVSLSTTHDALMFRPEPTHSYQEPDSIDAWLEFPVPEKSTALSLSVSRQNVWYVDKTEHLYYSSLKGPGLSWSTDSQPAEQISCSPSGFIIWRVYRGSAFSAVGRITGKSPAGIEWREVAREVAYVAADDSVVW